MPRSATVWSQEFDSLEAFTKDTPVAVPSVPLVAQGPATPVAGGDAAASPAPASVPTVPTDDQLADARDRAQRAVDAGAITAPGSDVTIAMSLDANGVMSVQVARKA